MNLLYIIDTSKTEFDNAVEKVLKELQYKHLNNGITNFIDKAKDTISQWLEDMLKRVFSGLTTSSKISESLSSIFLVVGLLALLVLIIFIAVRVSRVFERRRRVTEILGEKIDKDTTPFSLKEKAEGYAASEDLRQAIRYDFIALLLLMHEKNLVYLDETKTNEEIYNYLRRNSFYMLQNIRAAINLFNLIWYGHKDATKGIYDNWSTNMKVLWNGVMSYEEKSK